MLFKITSYFRFLAKSTNQHGVHSPFIFNLVTKCFYAKSTKEITQLFNSYRAILLHNKNFINVKDFGKGSKVFKSNKRQISKIASVAGISKKRGLLLTRLIAYFSPSQILEIGTSLGIATAAMHLGNSESTIFSLEGCPNTLAVAKEQFKHHCFINTHFIEGDFKNTLSKTINSKTFDFIYIDGNHQKEPTLNYFNLVLKSIHNDSVVIFDDIHWTREMQDAWEEIKNHPKVTVTIDTYQWGFVFFRKEQVKEHFTI